MNLWPWGWLAIAGPIVGVAGGVFGAYRSFQSATSSAERRLVVFFCLGITAYVALLCVALNLTPKEWHSWVWGPYIIGLSVAIRWANNLQQRIRQQQPVAKLP